MNKFKFTDVAFASSWRVTFYSLKNFLFLWMGLGIFLLLSIALSLLSDLFTSATMVWLMAALIFLISNYLQIGILQFALAFLDGKGKRPSLKILFSGNMSHLGHMLLTNILYALLFGAIIAIFFFLSMLLSFALPDSSDIVSLIASAIVTGAVAIYFGLRLSFGFYYVVDKNLNGLAAMKQSFHDTKGHFWELVVFTLATAAFLFVGQLLLVGFIVTLPILMLATPCIYRLLTNTYVEVPRREKEPKIGIAQQ